MFWWNALAFGSDAVPADHVDFPPEVADKDTPFWSFQPLPTVEPPTVTNGDWARTEIDKFVLAELESAEMTGEPFPLEKAEAAWTNAIARMRQRLLTMPSKLAPVAK